MAWQNVQYENGKYRTGSGGGGTSDYSDLTNKPQINGVTLSGNKSTSDLGISIPTKISDLTNDSDFIEKSATSGLIKNNGTIDTTIYAVDIGLSIVNGKICQTYGTS